jgi:hypothetical protein
MGIPSLEGYGIIFHNQANIPLSTTSIRRLEDHERDGLLTARLYSAFKRDSRFRCELRRITRDMQAAGHQKVTSTDMRSCELAHQWYHKAWNVSIAVTRRFLRGILPRNLEQISRLLTGWHSGPRRDSRKPQGCCCGCGIIVKSNKKNGIVITKQTDMLACI